MAGPTPKARATIRPITNPSTPIPTCRPRRGRRGRVRLSRHPVPEQLPGSFFYADYAQHWIKRLTFDANGNVTGVFNFEPTDGSTDGPYGDIVYLTEGPDGALYYVDLGFQTRRQRRCQQVRRISYVSSNQPPVCGLGATPTTGPPRSP